MNAKTTSKQVTVNFFGVLFTGWLVDQYATPKHDIVLVIQPTSYELQGKTFKTECDDSVFRVSASALVEVA